MAEEDDEDFANLESNALEVVICGKYLGTLSPFGWYGKVGTPARYVGTWLLYVGYMGTVRRVQGYNI